MSFKLVVLFILAHLLFGISHLDCAISEYKVKDNSVKCNDMTDDSKNKIRYDPPFFLWFSQLEIFYIIAPIQRKTKYILIS